MTAQPHLCPKGHVMIEASIVRGVILGAASGLVIGTLASVPSLRFLAMPLALMAEGFALAESVRGLERPEPARSLNRIPVAMAITLPFIACGIATALGLLGAGR